MSKNIASNSLTNFHKKVTLKGFSVAEAMIALLIGSIALGMAAPMITKQIKQNNFSDTQIRVINARNENMLDIINELIERIEILENQENSGIPKGTIAFFDNTVVAESLSNPCPKGWEKIGTEWQGRFPRFSGTYTIYDWDSTTNKHNTSGKSKTLAVGSIEEDAIRNIEGTFQGAGHGTSFVATGAFQKIGKGKTDVTNGGEPDLAYSFNAQRVVPTNDENTPKSVALLGCRKK